jgi:hypothetical protein
MVQLDLKFAALSDLARDGNGAVVQFHNPLANGQPDPEPGKFGSMGRPEKRIEI